MVQQAFLDNEEAVIRRLKTVYAKSLEDITDKAAKLQKEFEELESIYDNIEDEEEKKVLKSRMRSKVYQKQYQESLKKQVSGIIDKLHDEDYKTVSEYLEKCYDDGFIGTMYDLQGQGIPMCFPLDQESMVRAVQLDSKISEGLYNHLGENYSLLKKRITAEVSRGIASSMTYGQVAQQLAAKMTGIYKNPGGALAYSMRIARTEGHRIQCQATMDACYNAKDRGANIVKQWDATLDARTRNSHIAVDGEWKELDEKFSNGLMFPGDPSGRAEEVIHCRCALLQKSRDSLKNGFTKMNNFTKQLETFESPEDYASFKKAFFSKENKSYMNHVQSMEEKYKTKDFAKVLDKMDTREYNRYSKLVEQNPVFNKKATSATNPIVKGKTIKPFVNDKGEILTSSGNYGRIALRLDLFGEQDLKNQRTSSIKKGIRNLESKMELHHKKISNPENYVEGWNERSKEYQQGTLRHWKKEVKNFQESIDNRIAELKIRGEYDE